MKSTSLKIDQSSQEVLASLGLTEEPLLLAAARGEAARRTCTPSDPLTAYGFVAYQHMVRTLRDELKAHGWEPLRKSTWELVFNPATNIAIAPCMGNDGVGRAESFPQVVRGRGSLIADAVESGVQQLVLSDLWDVGPKKRVGTKLPFQVWFLLHYRTRSEIRLELSQPGPLTEDGFVQYWVNRIILESVPLPDSTPFSTFSEEEDQIPVLEMTEFSTFSEEEDHTPQVRPLVEGE